MKMFFVMDAIECVDIEKDTTLALMFEAQKRGHEVFYVKPETLCARGADAWCDACPVKLRPPDESGFCELGRSEPCPLAENDVVWMRRDPPVNMDYIYQTHILELAERNGATVINRPSAIRNSNEKLSALAFKDFIAETIVSKNAETIWNFLREKKKIVIKPLDGFGGEGILFLDSDGEQSRQQILKATAAEDVFVMAQRFIEEVSEGDKRVIMLDGKPIGAILRMPPEGGFICNFHSGGTPAKTELNERDAEICSVVGAVLKQTGIYFAGIDIVGGMLTEINCTSPTCVREINRFENVRLESKIMDFAESLSDRRRKNP